MYLLLMLLFFGSCCPLYVHISKWKLCKDLSKCHLLKHFLFSNPGSNFSILEIPKQLNHSFFHANCSLLGRKRTDTYSPLLVFPSSQRLIYSMILYTFSSLSLSLLQERGREFSIWGFRDKELLIADQHPPPSFPVWICFLFPFLKCYRSKSPVVTHTVYAWLARHIWIQGMKLGSSFLLSIKTMFSSISFFSNKNDLSSKNPDFLSSFTTWVDKRNAIYWLPPPSIL